MATDYYLQLHGINGESTEGLHATRIECLTVTWSMMQPKGHQPHRVTTCARHF